MLRSGAVLAALALLAAAATAGAGEPVNTMCPVMRDRPVDPRITVEHEGVTIGFCCLRCVRMFREDPEAYLPYVPGFENRYPVPPPVEVAAAAPAPAAPEGIDRAVRFAGRFHPVLVHLPIGLLLAAGLAAVLGRMTRRPPFDAAARYCLVLGAFGAAAAAPAGWAAAAHAAWPGLEETLEFHRWTGTAVAALAVLAAVLDGLRRRGVRRTGVLAPLALLLAVVLVVVAGHLGGTLVYGPDHYRW